MEIINCKELVKKHMEDIEKNLKKREGKKYFIIYQIGDNKASNTYVRLKCQDCEKIGITPLVAKVSEVEDSAQDMSYIYYDLLVTKVQQMLSEDREDFTILGKMLQLPVPKSVDQEKLAKVLIYRKELDVDGALADSIFAPCTPVGTLMLLEDLKVDLRGKTVTVIGRSKLVGLPLANLLIELGATVISMNSRTQKDIMDAALEKSDIIISAVGQRNLITKETIEKSKAKLLIDIGINFDEDGKICGDFSKEIYDMNREGQITSVPGGMGLYTRLALMSHLAASAYAEFYSNE